MGRSAGRIFFEDVSSHLPRHTGDVERIEDGQRLTSKRQAGDTPVRYYRRFVSDTVDSPKYAHRRLFSASLPTTLYTCPSRVAMERLTNDRRETSKVEES